MELIEVMDPNYTSPLLCDESKLNHHEPKVYGIGRCSLVPNSHTAQDLLEATVCSFYGLTLDELSQPQKFAFYRFQKRLEWLVELDIEDPLDPELGIHLKCLAKDIDDMFFFGSLCTGNPPIANFKLIEQEFVRYNNREHKGKCDVKTPVDGIPQCQIDIALGAPKTRLSEDLVVMLIHEMIHAYLSSFVCNRAGCSKDILNTMGFPFSNHGPTFRALHFAILSSLSDWDEGIKTLFDYIEPHPLLQKYELSEEEHAQKQCEAQDLYPRTIPNRDDCIRVYDWTVVIDIERLRETRCLFNRTLMDDTMNSV